MPTVTKYANATVAGWGTWNNTTNIYADDGNYMTTAGAWLTPYYIIASFPSCELPDLATIDSVTITLEYKLSTADSSHGLYLQASYNGSVRGTQVYSTAEPTTDTTIDVSAPGTWTRAELNSGLGGVLITVTRTGFTACTYSFDYAKIVVAYTEHTNTNKTLTAGVTVSASRVSNVAKALTANVSAAAAFIATLIASGENYLKTITAGVSVSASFSKDVAKTVAAGIVISTVAVKSVYKTLSAGVAVSSSAVKGVAKILTAGVFTGASLIKGVAKTLMAGISTSVTFSIPSRTIRNIVLSITQRTTGTGVSKRVTTLSESARGKELSVKERKAETDIVERKVDIEVKK